jgi:LysM repeat protein
LATKSARIQAELPASELILAIETKPLPAALLRIASIAEPEVSTTTRWVSIVAGIAVLVGLIIGGDYLLNQIARVPVTAVAASPTKALGKPTPAVAEPPPTANPAAPQPSVDLQSASIQSAPDQAAMAPAAGQPPAPSPGQPLSSAPAPIQEATTLAAAQSPVPAPSVEHEPRYITIGEGQTLIRIAHANHVPAAAIAAANQLEPPYPLKAGSQLLIPDTKPPADQDVQASNDKTRLVPTHPAPRMGQSGFEPH